MPIAHRGAFTLVELIIAIGFMIILILLGLYFLPSTESRLASRGADQLQTYVASARGRAQRDNVLTGVRLISNDNGKTYTEFQIIQSPQPFAPINTSATFFNLLPTGTPSTITCFMQIQADVSNSIAVGDLLATTVGVSGIKQPGPTSFTVPSTAQSNAVNRVTSISASGGVTMIGLASAPPFVPIWQTGQSLQITLNAPSTTANAGYRFIREPRPLMGETALQLPRYVQVESNSGGSLNIPMGFSGQFDIIFAPSGQVVNSSAGRIVLWVDTPTIPSATTLLCIYTRTGGVAAHPVNTDSTIGSPYYFTMDGKSSGQ